MKRPGDIVFVRTASIFGWLIRLFTGSRWNHVYLVFGEVSGMCLALEANGMKVRLIGKKDTKRIALLRLKDARQDIVRKHLDEMLLKVGEPYGFGQILGFLWVLFCKRFLGKTVRNPIGHGWDCSEFAGEFVHRMGMIEKDEWLRIKDSITPGELYDRLQSLPLDLSGLGENHGHVTT